MPFGPAKYCSVRRRPYRRRVPSIYEVVEDAGAAIERFDEASSPAEQRRTMREVLAHLYSLHQHWVSKSDPAFTRAVAAVGSGGDVAQGVLYARGKITHNITREVGPRLQGAVYDPAVYDMRHYEAGTLTWLHVNEMTPEDRAGFLEPRNKHGAANLVHYQRAVAGQPVRDTLMTARDFLVAPPGMPTL